MNWKRGRCERCAVLVCVYILKTVETCVTVFDRTKLKLILGGESFGSENSVVIVTCTHTHDAYIIRYTRGRRGRTCPIHANSCCSKLPFIHKLSPTGIVGVLYND